MSGVAGKRQCQYFVRQSNDGRATFKNMPKMSKEKDCCKRSLQTRRRPEIWSKIVQFSQVLQQP